MVLAKVEMLKSPNMIQLDILNSSMNWLNEIKISDISKMFPDPRHEISTLSADLPGFRAFTGPQRNGIGRCRCRDWWSTPKGGSQNLIFHIGGLAAGFGKDIPSWELTYPILSPRKGIF